MNNAARKVMVAIPTGKEPAHIYLYIFLSPFRTASDSYGSACVLQSQFHRQCPAFTVHRQDKRGKGRHRNGIWNPHRPHRFLPGIVFPLPCCPCDLEYISAPIPAFSCRSRIPSEKLLLFPLHRCDGSHTSYSSSAFPRFRSSVSLQIGTS